MKPHNKVLLCAALALLSISIIAVILAKSLTAPVPMLRLATNPGDAQVELEWAASPSCTGEWKFRWGHVNGTWSDWSRLPRDGAAGHVVKNLTNGTLFRFQVRFRPDANCCSSLPRLPLQSACNTLVSGIETASPNGPLLLSSIAKVVGVDTQGNETDEQVDRVGSGSILSILEHMAEDMGAIRSALEELSPEPSKERGFCPSGQEPKKIGVVRFDFGSDQPNSHADTVDNLVGMLLEPNQCGLVLVEGHASSRGAATYNLDLSERRTKAVASGLRDRLTAKCWSFRLIAKGESHNEPNPQRPLAENQNVTVSLCPPAGQ